MKLIVLLAVTTSLVACGGSPTTAQSDVPPHGELWCSSVHDRSCPIGTDCMADGTCYSVGTGSYDGTCDPTACQAWADLSELADGGTCADLCAAICVSTCSGDTHGIAYDHQDQATYGCDPTQCRF